MKTYKITVTRNKKKVTFRIRKKTRAGLVDSCKRVAEKILNGRFDEIQIEQVVVSK